MTVWFVGGVVLCGFAREERALFCPSMRHCTSKAPLDCKLKPKLKQILDMLGLESMTPQKRPTMANTK